MKAVWFGLLAAWVAIPSCPAGDISFLPDGKSIARCDDTNLRIKDLADEFPESEIALPQELAKEVTAMARTSDGLLAISGESVIMTWNPATKEWKPFWKVADGRRIDDLAWDPKSGDLLIVTTAADDRSEIRTPAWQVLPKDGKEAIPVFNRRAPSPLAPSFDAAGQVHFICHGDIWKGYLELEKPQSDSEGPRYILCGKRTWPIADLETELSSRNGALAKSVVAFQGKLLIQLDHSHSQGDIVRVPDVDAFKEGLPIRWHDLIETNGGAPLAVAADGKTAATHILVSRRWWVMEKADGDFEPLSKEGHAK